MPYATQQDLIDRFGEDELKEIADRDGDDVIDATVVSGVLGDADELINSYVGRRYDLPLVSAPAVLKRLACDIARYLLFKDAPPEVVMKNYDKAIALLRDVGEGKAVLDVGGSEPAPQGNAVNVTSRTRVFSRDTLDGY